MLGTILSAIVYFAATNFDEIFILMVFLGRCDTHREKHDISLGHFFGMAILTTLSLFAAYGLNLLPHQYLHWLGLIPIALALREIGKAIWGRTHPETVHNRINSLLPDIDLFAQIMIVSLVHGLDNLGVYATMFIGYSLTQVIVTAIVFAVMVEVWCALSNTLLRLPVLPKMIHKHAFWLVPLIYLGLGLHVLLH